MKKNWTRQRLADRLGVTTATIGYYETYKREPSYDNLSKLSKALNVSMIRIIKDILDYKEEIK